MPTTPPRHSRRASPDGLTRLQDLRTAEALVVSVLRLWAEPLRAPEETHPHWQDGLTAAGLNNDAAVAFDTVMRITIAAAIRPLDIHRPRCPMLGGDEAKLLDMIALLQHGCHGEAGMLLSDWLALAGVRMALAPLCILSGALDKAGLRLPMPVEAGPAERRKPVPQHAEDFTTTRATARVDRGATLVH
ncbi:hypothetical protein J2847_006237 [Azospirillum agricola]|uniref:hypothetical protein n=1 Tax=Azospirillum agricola TaxID=1720247 RepID=UPI001AE17759|nr:hypothetical protein [Azospirillum agricola]MBP2232903.1 hypothetical protein [Azospirillum agricola]